MLGYRIREILLGNWRNKGAALFFAVIIWLVAFRSEMQSSAVPVRLVLAALPEDRVIIRQEFQDLEGKLLPFEGTVVVSVSGARRQIQKLEGGAREVRLPVEAGANPDRKRLVLTDGSFPFTPPGVSITGISPDTLFLTFDVAEDRELPVEPIFQQIPVGMETEPNPKVEPATVTLHGPRSVLEKIKVVAEGWVRAMDRFDATVPLQLRYSETTLEKALVDRTVRFRSAQQARLTVRLRYKNDSFDAENVRVKFLIPGGRFPFRIQVQEETIAVRFQGPEQEILRLREKVKTPDFALAVAVPPLDSSAEQTFTEDVLLLYGFSERVQILQHPERKTQGKGAWTYSLIPLPAASPAGGK